LNNAYYIVLDYNLSEEDFYRELDRFERISVEYDGQIKVPIYDEKNFSLPVYVSIMRRNPSDKNYGDFEYVLVDEKNCRLVCILTINGTLKELPIDSTLKPPAGLNYDDSWSGFSIYSFSLDMLGSEGVFMPSDDEAMFNIS